MNAGGGKKYKKVFTFLEVVVVVGIILVFSAFIFFVVTQALSRSRDVKRIESVDQIKNALLLLYHDRGDYLEHGSGCGSQGNGSGWMNYSGDGYARSIMECLVKEGYLADKITDPQERQSMGTGEERRDFIKVSDSKRTCVFARLEAGSKSPNSTRGTTCPNCDSLYGMNYHICLDK